MSGESQLRHIHALDFRECKNGMSEYVCKVCAEHYFQLEECP